MTAPAAVPREQLQALFVDLIPVLMHAEEYEHPAYYLRMIREHWEVEDVPDEVYES